MAAYSQFLGKRVTVQYRFGDILLSASATFVADCGRSIFLEQHLQIRGTPKYVRWEIPYAYIHRIAMDDDAASSESGDLEATPAAPKQKAAAASAGASPNNTPLFFSLMHRPKTA